MIFWFRHVQNEVRRSDIPVWNGFWKSQDYVLRFFLIWLFLCNQKHIQQTLHHHNPTYKCIQQKLFIQSVTSVTRVEKLILLQYI